MLQKVPSVFTGGPLYATVAIFVAAIQAPGTGQPAGS
jgi:hypothetical protein